METKKNAEITFFDPSLAIGKRLEPLINMTSLGAMMFTLNAKIMAYFV